MFPNPSEDISSLVWGVAVFISLISLIQIVVYKIATMMYANKDVGKAEKYFDLMNKSAKRFTIYLTISLVGAVLIFVVFS